MLYIIQHFCQKARGKAHKGGGDLGGFLAILTGRAAAGARSCMNMQILAGHGTFFPCSVGRGLDLCAKSRALRPGCAPKRACGRRPRRGRSPHGNGFGFVYAVPGVCRGGIYASRQGCAITRGFREHRPFSPFCRAGVHARRTDDFLIFIMCGGVKTPPYRIRQTKIHPATPNTRKVCGPHTCGPYEPRKTPYKF